MVFKKLFLLAAVSLSAIFPVSAEWTLGPGIGGGESPSIRTELNKDNVMEVKKPVVSDGNLLRRARINAVIDTEVDEFSKYIRKRNEDWKTNGWIYWQEGMVNPEGITSFILFEASYADGAAHPITGARSMNFDKWGHKVTLKDLLPDLSAEDVNRAIEEQIPEERLFYNHSVNRVPKTFYVGKNGKIYVVFQQYEIGPYAAGFMVAEVGELTEKDRK